MAVDFSIFRANDIRGVADSSLSVDVAEQIGRALAAVAVERGFARIALGRDGRESSPRLSAAVASGLVAGGMRVFDIGVNPTPAVYYAAATRADGCGAVVTGSHNPKNYNGVKMMLGNETLSGDAVADLAARIRDGFAPSARVGGCEPLDVAPAYLAELRANIRLARPLKIVVDAGNGATGDFAPKMLRALGCEVDELFCEIDGAFPNHHPDPARPENLRAAANRRRELGADAAFVFDGDGDRLGAILPESGAVAADRLLMLFARDCLRAAGGRAVVFDVKCTRHLAPWIAACGGVAHMRPTGHAFIKRAMAELDAVCGGEMSGHFYFRDKWRGFDDAIFAAARLAEILARDPKRRRRFAGEPGLARNQYRFAGRRNPARIDAQNRGFGGYRAAARIVSARNQNKRDRRLANRIRRRLRLGARFEHDAVHGLALRRRQRRRDARDSIRIPRRAGRRRFAARDAVLAVPPRASARPPTIDDAGEYTVARAMPCPHFDSRPPAAVVSLIVIHSISLPPGVFGGGDVARFFRRRARL